jgi:hypothetical protein
LGVDRKLRVGVTLHLRENQSLWENGIFQNCAFLVQLLNRSPRVKRAVLVNAGTVRVPAEAMMLEGTGLSIIGLAEALQSLDVVIEMSELLPDEWASQFRARGGRYVWMRVGNDYVIDIERSMYGRPAASVLGNKQYDAVWTLQQYEHIAHDYFELSVRAPVRILPHLWTPYFFDRGIAKLPKDVKFGYQPGRPRWRICMFEPNVCLVKTSYFPMLVCEEAYRRKPSMVEVVRILNTWHMKDLHVFVTFARTLDIVNHGAASFEGRYPTFDYMAHHGDCIVSHQWENAQNYIYYEALYGGYPLIHNSPLIKDYGYYYPDFDCAEGGAVLVRAFEQHDANLDAYKEKGKQLLREVDTANPVNVETYTRELLRLFD